MPGGLYGTACVAVPHGPEVADHEEARLAYLRRGLGWQNVGLYAKTGRWEPERSGDVIELQLESCRPLTQAPYLENHPATR